MHLSRTSPLLQAAILGGILFLGVEAAPARLLGSSFGYPGNATFDYIVVGGGTAGLTVAARLAEDPTKTVAVVEAGSFYEIGNGNLSQIVPDGVWFAGKSKEDINPLIDWGFVVEPQAGMLNQTSHMAMGKTLGGNSARNYMAYQRGTKGSYQQWADTVGDSDYEWDNFLPYFQKSIHFTPPDMTTRAANSTPQYDLSTIGHANGPLSVTFSKYAQSFSSWVQLALKEIGIFPINGFTSGELIGSSYQLLTQDGVDMTRASSEVAFLQTSLNKTNYIVYQSTLGKRILFDDNKNAIGVEIDMGGRISYLTAKEEVIVSSGAFQSPHLLMVSGVGPAATLQKYDIPVVADRPGVGQNMWDHVLGGPSYRVNLITDSSLSYPEFAVPALEEFLANRTGIMSATAADLLAWEKIPQPLRSSFSNSTLADLSQFPSDWPEVEYLITSAYFGNQQNFISGAPVDGYQYATLAFALVAPLSRGTIDINSADMADPPLINPNWLTHPTDQAVAIAAYKRVMQLLNTTTLEPVLIQPQYFPAAELQVESSDASILNFVQENFNTVFHPAGTCSMGLSNDTNAVVDSKARVIGVNRLRVVDASAFPLLPPGHPQSTVYALAEKIAHDIKKGL